ncbi:MAG TPA: DUF433 domain-containing protein [Candidatus Kapabacteria bacterium]|nr:DUF433 domain-containing protein [Candidatus Kapabacteria bacterium]
MIRGKLKGRFVGRYIVSDPEICHGKPSFRGTRIMVSHVLEQVAEGMSWEAIIQEYRGNICKEAITEAVNLANQAFLEHAQEYTVPEYILEHVGHAAV